MTEATVSHDDALARRIKAWMDERFPMANALLFFILYLATAAVARAAIGGEAEFFWYDIIGCLATWSLFLVIRIFDEHKDYAIDVINHPQRVLQSGRITLNHLKALAIFSVIAQVIWSWLAAGEAGLIIWAIMFVYLCLMGAEFFCGRWLEKQLLLYALSHMAIMPLIVAWLAVIAVPQANLFDGSAPTLIAMACLAFVSGFCFEITRKTRGPEEERDTVDSYTRILGVKGASLLVIALVSAMVVNQVVLLWLAGVSWLVVYGVLLALVWVLAVKSMLSFMKAPTEAGREKNEKAVALTMLLGYLLVIIALLVTGGVA